MVVWYINTGGRKLSRILLLYNLQQLQKRDSCRGGDRRLPGCYFITFVKSLKFLFIVPLKNQRCLSTQVNSKRNSFAIFFYLSYIFTTIFYNSQIVESFNRFKLYPYNKKPSDLKKVRPLLRRAIKACRQEGGMPPMVEIEMPLRQGNQKL